VPNWANPSGVDLTQRATAGSVAPIRKVAGNTATAATTARAVTPVSDSLATPKYQSLSHGSHHGSDAPNAPIANSSAAYTRKG
jgi:hypothetical protein